MPIAAGVVSSSRRAIDRPGEPGAAPVLPDQLPGMQQQQRPERTRQDQRAELDARRGEHHDRHRQQHRQHALRAADDGACQLVEGDEGCDLADLRQQIDAEHVIAGGAEGDVGEPERQRRPHVGADLIFAAEGEDGGEIAGRAAVEDQRQQQPDRGLHQHHDPDHEARPGADQFDNQGGKPHETPEMPQPPASMIRKSAKRFSEKIMLKHGGAI
ncbi:hypothetical protein ACVILL_004780 [Bradyrhizobium sp. USDA 3364]